MGKPARAAVLATMGLMLLVAASRSVPSAELDRRAVGRTVERLLAQDRGRGQAPPIGTDREHAAAIAPVLDPGTAVLIHSQVPVGSGPMEARYLLSKGRLFAYTDVPFDPLEAPSLRIRPIDGGQDLPMLLEVRLTPKTRADAAGALRVVFPAPSIFRAEIKVRGVWVGNSPAEYELTAQPEAAKIAIRIPISERALLSSGESVVPASVLIDGVLSLGEYRELALKRFESKPLASPPLELESLAKMSAGRDYRGPAEEQLIRDLAAEIADGIEGSIQQVMAVNRRVSSAVRYVENPVLRWPIDVLQEGIGDCDDQTTLMVALLRALGVPSRRANGFLYDFNHLAAHSWVEVALPLRRGGSHWFICDPTLASLVASLDQKDRFVQFIDRAPLYPIRPFLVTEGLDVDFSMNMLIGHRRSEGASQIELRDLVRGVTASVESHFERLAADAAESRLELHRELPISAGSRYVVFEREVVPDHSLLRTSLENEERIVVALEATDSEGDLSEAEDRAIIAELAGVYESLSRLFFAGVDAHRNLELAYLRDPHTDRLLRVSLRFHRYVVEHHFSIIRRALRREGLWSDDQAEALNDLYVASGGANLYFLQELALWQRRTQRAADGALN